MIDLHSHILPGLDDGCADLDASVALARAAVADGVAAIAATPHVRDDYPTSADAIERALARVRERLAAERIPLEVLPGAEIALDRLGAIDADELPRLGLGGNPRLLLLEFPYGGWPLSLEQHLFELAARGFRVVIAHPERNAQVRGDPERLRPLVERGALVQLTAASVDGRLGRRVRDASAELLARGLAHLLASDAHEPAVRAVGLRAAADAVGGGALAEWLVERVPRALLDDAPLPERPREERTRPRWRRLLGGGP